MFMLTPADLRGLGGGVKSGGLEALILKDVPGGFPKSDLLGVTVALIHVVGQQFLAV